MSKSRVYAGDVLFTGMPGIGSGGELLRTMAMPDPIMKNDRAILPAHLSYDERTRIRGRIWHVISFCLR
jgi:hypothetical protein